MHSGKSFKLWYIFVKMYWENRYILTSVYWYIFDMYQSAKNVSIVKNFENSGTIFDIFGQIFATFGQIFAIFLIIRHYLVNL